MNNGEVTNLALISPQINFKHTIIVSRGEITSNLNEIFHAIRGANAYIHTKPLYRLIFTLIYSVED